ncbi:MAG: helix-turn-helix domain-containing protein [Gammaproteobacteria bacterium]|nr:helix-turn-helix domain-containing protein [Gammaproteobacteria bacterium]
MAPYQEKQDQEKKAFGVEEIEEACPIMAACSALSERWTLQIVREMFMGATRFSEFETYLPKMSPTLLSKRLRSLEEQGIVLKKKLSGKKGYEYRLTPQGQALKPVLTEMGRWGMGWVFDTMDQYELDAAVLVRDFAVAMKLDELPSGDATIQFIVTGEDAAIRRYVTVRDGSAEVCNQDLGHEADVYLTADLKTYGRIWYGEVTVADAVEKGILKVVGNRAYTDCVSRWLGTSQFSSYNRNANTESGA